MKSKDLEKNLWDIANALTAYPIAQGVFLSFKFSERDFRDSFVNWPSQVSTLALLLLVGWGFERMIRKIHRKVVALDGENAGVLGGIEKGRVLGVWAFGVLLPLVTLFAPKVFHLCSAGLYY
jgi:hypothetical protein